MRKLCQVCGTAPALLGGSCEDCTGQGCPAISGDIDDVCDACDCWKSLPRCITEMRRRVIEHRYGTEPAAYTIDVLQKLADGPILHPGRVYLPCGRLSVEAWRAREARILRGEAA